MTLINSSLPLSTSPVIPPTLPLTMASAGQPLKLVAIHAGHKLTRRLAEMGLTRGVTLEIIQADGGPLLISVRGSRIALGRGIAHKLHVAPTA